MIGDAYKLAFDNNYECREYWPQLQLSEDGKQLVLTRLPAWEILLAKFRGLTAEGLGGMTLIDELPPSLVYAAALSACDSFWSNTAHRLQANPGIPRTDIQESQRISAVSFVKRTVFANMSQYSNKPCVDFNDFDIHSMAGKFIYLKGWKKWCALNRTKGFLKAVPVPHRLVMARDTANQSFIWSAAYTYPVWEPLSSIGDDILSPVATMPPLTVVLSYRSSDRHYKDRYPPFIRHAYEQYYYDDLARRASGMWEFDARGKLCAFVLNARKIMADIFYSVTAETGDPTTAAYWQRCAAHTIIRQFMTGDGIVPAKSWVYRVGTSEKSSIAGTMAFTSITGILTDLACRVQIIEGA